MTAETRPAVLMLGLRGFPGVQGGVETHCENLCRELVAAGLPVAVIVRTPYMRHMAAASWNGVRYHRIWCPRSKGLEAVVHSVLGVLLAAVLRPDVLHVHAIGPSLVVPLARLLGLRVVMTHHGPDYERQKWGAFARRMLRLGEWSGVRFANVVIAISRTIQEHVRDKYQVDALRIPNGVSLPELGQATETLAEFDLVPGRYVLMVTRLVPEKRHLDAIAAFGKALLPGWKLAIVGESDHPDEYSRSVLATAQSQPGIVFTGFQTGGALAQLYTNAGVFVLPSSHEGLPIALLEALSYGIRVIASDIPPHTELGLPEEHYFRLGDTDAFAARMTQLARLHWTAEEREEARTWVSRRYNWPDIAQQTIEAYRRAAGGDPGREHTP